MINTLTTTIYARLKGLKTLLVGDAHTGGNKWSGGVLAPNGKIYFIPFNASQILMFDPLTNSISLVGNTYIGSNKWNGGVLAPNGKIYFTPHVGPRILELSGVSSPNIIGSDALIPLDLADLPTSNYNKYYNK